MATTKFQPPPTYAMPVIEDARTKKLLFNPIWLKWFLDLSQNLGVTGAASGSVSSITAGPGLAGGVITNVGTISLKSVGTAGTYGTVTTNQYGQVVSGTAEAVGLSLTITTAKLTTAGADGSMTFTNGRLTAQTAAT